MRRLRIVLPGALAAAVIAGPALAAATLVVVSATPSPYATCANAKQPGTNFANAEVEPFVSVNPTTVGTNRVNVVGVWQQDRWSNGGAHGLVAGFSFNGGKTWGQTTLPFSMCAPNAILDPFTGAPYNRASDPWVSIGPDGTAYAVGLMATNDTRGTSFGLNDTGVGAATSGDGGHTWGNARLIKADQGTSPVFEFTQFFNDKEAVTADPLHPGTAYVVWDRLQAPSHSPDAALRAHASRGPTWLSKTTDGGRTWTGTRAIFDPGQNSQTLGNQIVVDPRTGTLYDFFELFVTTGSPNFEPRGDSIGVISSTDGGASWSAPVSVSTADDILDVDPNTGQALRTAEALPSVAIDASTGQLYVVWEDARFTGSAVNQVVLSTSTDGGATWSTPKPISRTPTNRPAFTPTVAVNASGTVGVTYYDLRNLAAGNTATLPTDVWLTTSLDHGATFNTEVHVAGPFNMFVAPNAGGFFVGDYEAIGVNGSAFLPFFVQTNCADTSCTTNPTDVYTGPF